MENINNLTGENKIIYIRESIFLMDTRLTLKDFFSENLQANYNAVYRTPEELLNFFKKINDISSIEYDRIHRNLNKHSETGAMYFILKEGDIYEN